MYKIAICDDDKRYRKTIREIVEHENSLHENEIRFYEYESGNELLKHTDILHELVFIDIRMPGLDGNQTALKLRNYNKDAVLIFCSSYFEPTVDSINFGQPFRYIMKDLHDTSLRREIAAIMTEVKRRFLNDYAVTVTSAGKIIRIHVENILYVSRAKRGCVITIVKEQEKETVRCRESFGELCEQLKDQGFAQAHYSYMDIVDRIAYMKDGKIDTIYTPKELQEIPEEKRKNMGLRTVDMKNIHPVSLDKKYQSPILFIKDVTLFYKKQLILSHISLQASKGEIIGIIGPNGAGKTTFLRALCGLHKEYTGHFFWQGHVQKEEDRMKLSYMVMQDVNYELFADSVETECSLGIRNADSELIEKTLDKLNLLAVRKRHPNTLSGGQKQRVAVAVSMICGKEVLVFDEPTSGLDYDSMNQVSELIKELAKSKIIFVVTHDYEFICQACTRILHFDHQTITNDFQLSKKNEKSIWKLMDVGRDE